MQTHSQSKEGPKKPSYYAFPGLIRISWHALQNDEKLQYILSIVKECFESRYNDNSMYLMYTKTRSVRYVTARMIFYYFGKKYAPGITFKKLGIIFKQDHSTVLHACHIIQGFIDIKDTEVTALIDMIEKNLKYE